MRPVPAHPLARLGFDPLMLLHPDAEEGIVISTGWGGTPPGTIQDGNSIPLAAIAASVTIEPVAIAGGEFQRVEATKAWNTFKNISITLPGIDAEAGGRLFVGNFVDVRIDLSAAGDQGFEVLVVGAKRGLIRTGSGEGSDVITLVSHSNEGFWSNLMVIETFGGDDRIDITTISLSQLDDVMLAELGDNGPLWNALYDGRFSRYLIDPGDGDDIVTIRGNGRAVVHGGAGDDLIRGGGGDDWLDGGAGTDVLFGGAGNDTFVLRRGEILFDLIADFSLGGEGGRDTLLLIGFGPEAFLSVLDAASGLYAVSDGPGDELALFLVQGLGGLTLSAGDYLFA